VVQIYARSLKYTDPVLFFAADSMVLSHIRLHNKLRKNLDEVVRYGRSKSFKLIEIGTKRGSPYANYCYSPLL